MVLIRYTQQPVRLAKKDPMIKNPDFLIINF